MELLRFWLVLTTVLWCNCIVHPPIVADGTDQAVIVVENTTIGTLLWTLKASDDDHDDIIIGFPDYETESKKLVVIKQTSYANGQATADILLNHKLDRDYNPSKRRLLFVLTDNSMYKFQTVVVVDLWITDVNDESPVFQNLPYRTTILEDKRSGIIVYTKITAIDPDSGKGGQVTYSMQPITQSTHDATLFKNTFGIDSKTGHILLKKALDYELMQFYQFKLNAVDGYGMHSTEVLTIRIYDVQDTPPKIDGSPYVVTISENLELGSHIFTARAIDGDRGVPNHVQYSFQSGQCLDLFAIGSHTGEITVSGDIDRDSGDIMNQDGMCEITILVSEVETGGQQSGTTSTSTTISTFITDENDNLPTINYNYFSAQINDNAHLNYALQFENDTEIHIEDKDQGSCGIITLVLRDEDGSIARDFEPIPSIIASHGYAHIALKSPDFKTRNLINLKLYAVEKDTSEQHTASAVIRIKVVPGDKSTQPTTTPPPNIQPTTTPPPTIQKDEGLSIKCLAAAALCVILLVCLAITCCCNCRQKNKNLTSRPRHTTANGQFSQQNVRAQPYDSPLYSPVSVHHISRPMSPVSDIASAYSNDPSYTSTTSMPRRKSHAVPNTARRQSYKVSGSKSFLPRTDMDKLPVRATSKSTYDLSWMTQ